MKSRSSPIASPMSREVTFFVEKWYAVTRWIEQQTSAHAQNVGAD